MRLILAKPRGFCAGVDRAIECVEQALERYGAPVYVYNDIVHNAHVVEDLRNKGAVFVKDLHDVPEGANLLFSAHGVGPQCYEAAKNKGAKVIDATCPLVEKVHNEARRFARKNRLIVLIGEPNHDETVGTMGWAPEHIRRVLTVEDVERLDLPEDANLSYITQTTLSVDDCTRVIEALKRKYPHIQGPPTDDICYATTNRQNAVKQLTPEADLVLVVGDPASANSNRLVDIAQQFGKPAYLISDVSMIQPAWLDGIQSVLLTAGASAPEHLVDAVIEFLKERKGAELEERDITQENVHFKLPKELFPAAS